MDTEKLITYANLRNFAYTNDQICTRPIRGVVLFFTGLNGCAVYNEDAEESRFFAERGILYIIPYNNPWAWMNRQAVAYTDEILDVLFRALALPADMPVISTGKSMGGLSAIVYTAYAKRTPTACITNCPVCDAVYHYTERPDLPRTLYSALFSYEGSLDTALRSISPLHLVKRLPYVRYHIFHCEEDMAVSLQQHSRPFAEAMTQLGHHITLETVPDRGHCDLPEEVYARFLTLAAEAV